MEQLVAAAVARGRRRIAVAYAQDAHTLEAVNDAVEAGMAEATLFGDPAAIEAVCREEGIDCARFDIVPCFSDVECVVAAVRMVREGNADILMKGLVSTDKYMRGILNKERGLVPPKGVLSHVTLLEMPQYHKLLMASDVAVIEVPDLRQKAAIIRYMSSLMRRLGTERPKVACIAPSEQLLPGMASSVEAAMLAKMGERGQLGNIAIDGPISLDLALDAETVRLKKFRGNEVAGDSDCLLFPNLDAANTFFKCATKLCRAELAGLVVGASAPCVLTSRGDTRRSKLYSIALGCISVSDNGK